MRRKLYEIIDEAVDNNPWSKLYDVFMIFITTLSLIPLAFKEYTSTLIVIDYITVSIFIIDYILRLATADIKFHKTGLKPFLLYPITPMALVDLLAILPALSPLSRGFKLLKLLKLLKFARVIKALNFLRHSKYVGIIENVFKKQKDALFCVITISFLYILASALLFFNAEPDSFKSFFDAVYYATISLTNLFSNQITLTTTIGKVVSMLSSLLGIVVFSLPTAILTAGYINEIKVMQEEEACTK